MAGDGEGEFAFLASLGEFFCDLGCGAVEVGFEFFREFTSYTDWAIWGQPDEHFECAFDAMGGFEVEGSEVGFESSREFVFSLAFLRWKEAAKEEAICGKSGSR